MNVGDTRLEDFFLRFILENSQELEKMVKVKLDRLWKIKRESNKVLLAQGTGDDGESNISIHLNIGEGDKRFVAKIQDLIIEGRQDNSILCIAKNFNKEDVEELVQNVVSFYKEKNTKLIFITIKNYEESEEINFNDIIKEEV
ncbi:MAG: hypothetical protein ACLTDM_00345 [Clostridium butyricum]